MAPVDEVAILASASGGAIRVSLRIALLPRPYPSLPVPLLRRSAAESEADSLATVQLVEDYEYKYTWEGLQDVEAKVSTDPEEVFQPDSADGRQGRLRPGRSTGTMVVGLRRGVELLGRLELEVRSRKLNYLSEYRWMLRDIADQLAELVMDRFAVSSATFAVEGTRDAVTLYQRFAFLRSQLESESFRTAIDEITRRPHVAWEERHEVVLPGQALRASSHTIRQLSRAGTRAHWPGGSIASIPSRLDRRRTEATNDTTPNRFARFALDRWRQVIADIDRALEACQNNPAIARGRREIAQTLEQLDSFLHHDLFKELGHLQRFPADDQVLQRREGYRDVFRAYVEFELAAQLSWRGSSSTYSAGQRDVATLYEYWAFIQLARIVARLAGQSFDLRPLIETGSDGLNVALQRGKETVLHGTVERLGRKLAVSLCFNRTYSDRTVCFSSWTKPMRPDYSLIITAAESEDAGFEPIVLHFDAKYRVTQIVELFGEADEVMGDGEVANEPSDILRRAAPLRADLLKMHAYRDAIKRSAGAYVLFPGDDNANSNPFMEYRELLPGLGAFVLRPSDSGDAAGLSSLNLFLDAVFDHVATRLTTYERGRYWHEKVYGRNRLEDNQRVAPSSVEPTPDSSVLLGYVKNRAHWEWIRDRMTYNVRTENRPGGVSPSASLLFSQLLLLYCPDIETVALARIISDPEFIDRKAMKGAGYPNPRGDYLCVQFSWLAEQHGISTIATALIDQLVRGIGQLKGQPTSVAWAEVVRLRDRLNR